VTNEKTCLGYFIVARHMKDGKSRFLWPKRTANWDYSQHAYSMLVFEETKDLHIFCSLGVF
jgi:hypothetical protein